MPAPRPTPHDLPSGPKLAETYKAAATPTGRDFRAPARRNAVNLKLRLIFDDRVGIVADISALIARHNLNILSMEVVRDSNEARVYLEAEAAGQNSSHKEELFNILGRVAGLKEMSLIDTLPQEERERRFAVILDNISNGVAAIDTEGRVTVTNKVFRQLIAPGEEDVIGRHVKSFDLPDTAILDCLEGREFTNVKRNLVSGPARYQFFASGRPIRDSRGRIIGAVVLTKDMEEIKMLASTISEPCQVTFSDIVGTDPAILKAIAFAQKIARTDSIVSIRGASGTGKELFARAVHHASGRSGPFVPINCAALPEQLLESELFGYVGGAFTGGKSGGKPGLFEVAKGGTVFLDELAEMPLPSQAKLLRLLQEKRVRRIGDSREITIDARIVTATNQNLELQVERGQFRQDLYYRVNVLPVHIPPLKERAGDIPLLVNHFLFQLSSRLGKNMKPVTEAAMRKLNGHDWPGNVRELRNVIERAAILCTGDTLDVDCVLFSHEAGRAPDVVRPNAGQAGSRPLREQLDELEGRVIAETLRRSRSIREASRALGLSHTALLNKMKKLGLATSWKHNEPLAVN